MDYGEQQTEYRIRDLERRFQSIYAEAAEDVQKKLDDFTAKYAVKNKKYLEQLSEGKITQEQYESWVRGQVFQGNLWKAKRDEIAEVLSNSNIIATDLVNTRSTAVFINNANYMAYRMEKFAGANFGFGLYDSATITRLIKEEPNLIPRYSLNRAKDKAWNTKKITRQVALGIIEGERLDQIAERISTVTSVQNKNAMLTHARTTMTAAQNSGRQVRIAEAQNMGIDVKKMWMATLDKRTRDSHRDLDGETASVHSAFSNGLMYPGDPEGRPEEIYNCRCTIVAEVVNYPDKYQRYDNIDGVPIENMTYREWEKAKTTSQLVQDTPRKLEFTQIGIGLARSVEEVNEILNSANLWHTDITGVASEANLTGCDLDSAKSIAAAYEQVFAKYPKLRGKFDAPDAHPIGMKSNTYAWCYSRFGGKVQVNPDKYNNWQSVVRKYEKDVISNWHPYGTTAESIVTHEIGHAIDGYLAREGILGGYTSSGEFRYASSSLKTTIMKRVAKMDDGVADDLSWGMETAIRRNVSEYATENPREWFAECFAEYITSANPRIVAREFGKALEELMGRLP